MGPTKLFLPVIIEAEYPALFERPRYACYMVILAVAVPTDYILILINIVFYILRFYVCQYLFSILA